MSDRGAPLRRIVPALAVALVVAATGCAPSGDQASAGPTTAVTATTAPTTTTTTTTPPPPGGRRPTGQDPLRVLMAGDSLMADLSLALASTLNDGGATVARLVAAPSVPRDDVTRALWQEQLRRFDPEVVVVLIGVWEGMAEEALTSLSVGTPTWQRTYRRLALDPYLELLTSRGAEVIWIGMPPGRDPTRQVGFSALNRSVQAAARQRDDVYYVPGDRLLAAPDGSWRDVLPGPGGRRERVRRVDTTHLCPAGVVRLVEPVLDRIQSQWDVPLAPRWKSRDWQWVFPPGDCPPP